jgi:hypothetical protein
VVAVVASAWLETLLDVIDLLPAAVIKSDVSVSQFVVLKQNINISLYSAHLHGDVIQIAKQNY